LISLLAYSISKRNFGFVPVLLVTDKVLQNQEMAARTKVTLLAKAFALERREMGHIPVG
jgi:hypothetical protein